VYNVCKINKGRDTAGVDGMSISEDKKVAEVQMISLLDEINITSKPKSIRRVFIPKPNGKKRPLGIPTIKDRINQDIIRMTIEPICEFNFLSCSYGFRPKRSCQDASEDIFIKLGRKVSRRWIVEGDIKGCFDNIKHSHILETLSIWGVSSWIINLIEKMLSSGGKVGTPQGGIISPMLANVALTCLDQRMEAYGKKRIESKMNPIVRYADDFVIVAKDETEAITIKEMVKDYLKDKVGLELSEEKTHITEISEGFDFLGFNIRKYNGNFISKPTKENIKEFRQKITEIMRTSQNWSARSIIMKLNPIIDGWGNYYRHVVSKRIFKGQDQFLFWKVYNWTRRKHRGNGAKWIYRRYYKRIKGDKWNFFEGKMLMKKMKKIPIKRFIKVRKDVRVYNMDDREYWDKRKYMNAKDSIYNSYDLTYLFREQNGKCVFCEEDITQSDIQSHNIHKHHLKPKVVEGEDEKSNLKLLHRECHKELHGKISWRDMASYIDKGMDYTMLLKPA
jgi:RNA-directed DNA polymerase